MPRFERRARTRTSVQVLPLPVRFPARFQERRDGAIRHEPGQFPDHLGGVGVRCYARLPSLSPTYRELGMVTALPMQDEVDPVGRYSHDDLHKYRT